MTKTLPLEKKNSVKLNFFNNFVIESVDQNGRTSLRQVISTDRQGRPSILNPQQSDRDNPSSGGSGPSLKLVRKSELSQDMFENKSVISIKGEKDVSYKYGVSSDQLAAQLAANLNYSMTAPPKHSNAMIKEMQNAVDRNESVKESLMNTLKNPMISPNTTEE